MLTCKLQKQQSDRSQKFVESSSSKSRALHSGRSLKFHSASLSNSRSGEPPRFPYPGRGRCIWLRHDSNSEDGRLSISKYKKKRNRKSGLTGEEDRTAKKVSSRTKARELEKVYDRLVIGDLSLCGRAIRSPSRIVPVQMAETMLSSKLAARAALAGFFHKLLSLFFRHDIRSKISKKITHKLKICVVPALKLCGMVGELLLARASIQPVYACLVPQIDEPIAKCAYNFYIALFLSTSTLTFASTRAFWMVDLLTLGALRCIRRK